MRRAAALITLLAGSLSWGATQQASGSPAENSSPACPFTATLDDLIGALDAAVSGPANKDRTCLRDLLLPEARLSPIAKEPNGSFAPHLMTVDGWIEAVARRGSEAFYERQVKIDRQEYGHIAHLWCAYEIRPTPESPATVHGVNSIQAVFDGNRWRVLSILWEAETTARAMPESHTP